MVKTKVVLTTLVKTTLTTLPELPKKKVGIIACSGEELPEGTVTRLAALRVLEELRPGDTVTICLPLFLAGGQGDRRRSDAGRHRGRPDRHGARRRDGYREIWRLLRRRRGQE